MTPDKIKCALCTTEFWVMPFTTGHSAGDVTSCQAKRTDGSICGRIFQHSINRDTRNDGRVVMRVSPESQGL